MMSFSLDKFTANIAKSNPSSPSLFVQTSQEGFDPAQVNGDSLLLRDRVAKTFVPLTQDLHKAIRDETLRL